MSESNDGMWAALNALPKPVTKESVEECARSTLNAKQAGEFIKWLGQHQAYLLGRLNG